ncbi:UDP-N-acetylmuramoyl-tripeptide--D-alanyl-D-alanine ligase [Blattabacterium cuenoti]|uniref:UDP-N-acetylmuramoyl-tripeptide--D-alanyl-D- alanine ligase n=1 Tax=Blattabacterium cuenoti TaxID=1653831 RepID=UPI00163BB61F|nr:UDP-N-acetylmuramoyl-tripeptide--D-alanyl-D-alanine ligase [Blattabacterium cuenoti]
MTIQDIYKIYTISSGIEINSKKVKKKSIFLALKGENFDGNQFVAEAIRNGAILVIMDNKKYFFKNKKIFFVKNALIFLQKLAIYHRHKCINIPIIAIVGSNGKTTTKELTKNILSKEYDNVHYTKHNFNNHIGIPLTILSMPRYTKISVIEIGASHEKEIENMCSIINPDYGCITNFGKAHLEGFGGFNGVIRSKLELYNFLRKNKKLVFVNGDDPIQSSNSKKMRRFIFSGNKQKKSDVNFQFIHNNNIKSILCVKNTTITSSLIGDYNIYNIALSITIGIYFKISLKKIKKAIEEYIPNNHRSQILNKKNGKIIIDCYNANPTSMIRSLIFFDKKIYGSKIVILGDMLELGHYSNEEHEKILIFLNKSTINKAFLIGKNFYKTKNINSKKISIKKFFSKEKFIYWIKKNPIEKIDYLFIKGSRKIALETIIPSISLMMESD